MPSSPTPRGHDGSPVTSLGDAGNGLYHGVETLAHRLLTVSGRLAAMPLPSSSKQVSFEELTDFDVDRKYDCWHRLNGRNNGSMLLSGHQKQLRLDGLRPQGFRRQALVKNGLKLSTTPKRRLAVD